MDKEEWALDVAELMDRIKSRETAKQFPLVQPEDLVKKYEQCMAQQSLELA